MYIEQREEQTLRESEQATRRKLENLVLERIAQRQSKLTKHLDEVTRENDKLNCTFQTLTIIILDLPSYSRIKTARRRRSQVDTGTPNYHHRVEQCSYDEREL